MPDQFKLQSILMLSKSDQYPPVFLPHRELLLQLQPQLSREFHNNQLLSREFQLHSQSSLDQLHKLFSQDLLLFLRELFPANLSKLSSPSPDQSSPLPSSSLDSSLSAKANKDQLNRDQHHSPLLVVELPDRDQSNRSSWEFLPSSKLVNRDQLQLLLNLPSLIADSSLRPDHKLLSPVSLS